MHVTVRLFARLREIAGRDTLSAQVPDGARVADVWRTLAQEFPALVPYESTVSCAVNEEYGKKTDLVTEGDEVAFLPPVSGG